SFPSRRGRAAPKDASALRRNPSWSYPCPPLTCLFDQSIRKEASLQMTSVSLAWGLHAKLRATVWASSWVCIRGLAQSEALPFSNVHGVAGAVLTPIMAASRRHFHSGQLQLITYSSRMSMNQFPRFRAVLSRIAELRSAPARGNVGRA